MTSHTTLHSSQLKRLELSQCASGTSSGGHQYLHLVYLGLISISSPLNLPSVHHVMCKLNPRDRSITLTKLLIKHAKFTQKETEIGA